MRIVIIFTGILLTSIFSCTQHERKGQTIVSNAFPDFIYQYSVMDALLAGTFDGNLKLGELKEKGDFGIGTFNRLDGELLLLDGMIYKLRHNGEISKAEDRDSTSLAFVKFFETDTTITMKGKDITYKQVLAHLDTVLNRNSLYAIKMYGDFKTMRARAVMAASKPYPELSSYLEKGGQQLFAFTQAKGVCAGFLLPPYTARTNVPGIHLHFIADDRKQGGHVFDFTTDALKIEIDEAKGFIVERNTHRLFNAVDLDSDRKKQLESVE